MGARRGLRSPPQAAPKLSLPSLSTPRSRLYSPQLQSRLSFAQYWKNPFNLSAYRTASGFLRDVNNEDADARARNATYADRLAELHSLLLVGFLRDEVLVPRETATFGFYAEGSSERVVPLRESALYTDDLIGLRRLDARGALREAWANCTHSDPPHAFFEQEVLPLLNNSLPALPSPEETSARLRTLWDSLAAGAMRRLVSTGEWLAGRARVAMSAAAS